MIQGVIAVCSRGLVHSRTMKSLWRAIPPGWRSQWELLTTDDLPIPEAQTSITQEALSLDPEWIWYVEEDIGLPDGILIDMFAMGKPVVTADYPLARYDENLKKWIGVGNAVRRNDDGSIRFCGMGCLLVQADIFRRIKQPWFETWSITRDGGVLGLKRSYGGQDIWLAKQIIDSGVQIAEVPAVCRHYRLEEPGSIAKNSGVHRIIELSSVA